MKLTIIAATGSIGRHLVEQAAAAAGHDVASALGPRNPRADAGITSRHHSGDGFFMRYLGTALTHAMFGRHYADLAVTEQILRDSSLDWTVSRPPELTDKPLTGAYRTAFTATSAAGSPCLVPTSPTTCSP
jgi:uncharacterized protein YbjT (DUF2867 family)